MKRLRKALMALAAVCVLVSGFSFSAYASSGELRFSDPSTTVGAEVEVTATFTGSTAVQSVDATLTYDTAMLRFIEGGQITDNGGTLSLSGAGDGMSTQLNFTMKFQALQEGTTQISVSDATGIDVDGDTIEVTNGQSTVTIGPGDPSLIQTQTTASGGTTVDVNGTSYTISADFSDAILPAGFARSEMQFEGQTVTAVTQAASGATALYLVPADGGDGDFFLYDTENGSFSPFEQIQLSPDRYLILLQDDGTVNVPGGYQETTLTLNGKEFPAWQNMNNTEYYLVYGLNSDGNKVLYQYDTTDGTYQKYVRPMSISTDESGNANGILGKVLQFIEDHLRWVMAAACALFALVVLILIVALVKLHHRNLELDDLYDEYGIDLDEEPENAADSKKKKDKKADKKAEKKAEKKSKKKKEEPEDDGFESFEDFEDDYEEEDFDDPADDEYDLDEEDFVEDFDEDLEDDYDAFVSGADRSFGEVSRQTPDADEEDIDDLDALLNARVREPEKRPRKKPERRSHAEEDDTFKMDIIDLD